jgi:integrase
MVSEPLRYVTVRRNKNGTERYYWQRRGHPLTRLPDDPVERLAKVVALNNLAEGKEGATPHEGTVAWCIDDLQRSDEWDRLAETSRRIYKRWLDEFKLSIGAFKPAKIDRAYVKSLLRKYRQKPSTVRHVIATLSLICEVAREHSLMTLNPCHKLKMPMGGRRDQVFTDEDCRKFLEACRQKDIRDAFMVLRYTAQRPIDALRLPGSAFDGKQIALRQQKTGATVWIHCHRELRQYIAKHMTPLGKFLIHRPSGKQLHQRTFNLGFRDTLDRAGLSHLQARDLRRTAVCMLDDAGCTPSQIASVTGHSESSIVEMLKVYRPKLKGVSKIAIEKWESLTR